MKKSNRTTKNLGAWVKFADADFITRAARQKGMTVSAYVVSLARGTLKLEAQDNDFSKSGPPRDASTGNPAAPAMEDAFAANRVIGAIDRAKAEGAGAEELARLDVLRREINQILLARQIGYYAALNVARHEASDASWEAGETGVRRRRRERAKP